MHKKLIVGNLKMNPLTPTEFGRYLDGLEKDMKGKRFEKTEIVVCPPAVYFRQFVERKMKDVKLGAQDVYWEYQGAFTGEISAGMMKANGAQYSIVGHSERRKYFGENEEIINLKLKAILKSGLNAILCIGESGEERKSNQTAPVLKKQLEKSLAGIGVGKSEYITIAYEPIWAVGTDKIPSSDEVLEAKIIIKKGEIQLTQEHRANLRERKRKQIINMLHVNGVDPRTHLPHPPQRIENALEEAKFHVEEFGQVHEQVQEALKKLRPILPIKFEVKEISVKIPAQFAAKSYQVLSMFGTKLREEWQNDGSLLTVLEMPGGLESDFYDKINSLTHGNVETKVLKIK